MKGTANYQLIPDWYNRDGQFPRKPTAAELNELRMLVVEEYDDPSIGGEVDQAYIAVFPYYGGPVARKLMVVVWSGNPNLGDVYIWRDGQLVHVDKED